MKNVLENSGCLLPTSMHLNEDMASAGSRDVAVFAKGDLGGISKRGGTVPAPMQVCDAWGSGVDKLRVSLLDISPHLEYISGGTVLDKQRQQIL
jgi:hypothetical protein